MVAGRLCSYLRQALDSWFFLLLVYFPLYLKHFSFAT